MISCVTSVSLKIMSSGEIEREGGERGRERGEREKKKKKKKKGQRFSHGRCYLHHCQINRLSMHAISIIKQACKWIHTLAFIYYRAVTAGHGVRVVFRKKKKRKTLLVSAFEVKLCE